MALLSISPALPIIAEELRGTGHQAFWSGTSFLLAVTVLQPNFVFSSSIFGRKPFILLALVSFSQRLSWKSCPKFTLLLIGRSLQGVAGGGIIALIEIIVTDLFLSVFEDSIMQSCPPCKLLDRFLAR
jgi:MFS family permease